MPKSEKKSQGVLEFICPYCEEGIQALWLSPQAMLEAEMPEFWVYRCDRCGQTLTAGVGMLRTDGTGEAAKLVEVRKDRRRFNREIQKGPRVIAGVRGSLGIVGKGLLGNHPY